VEEIKKSKKSQIKKMTKNKRSKRRKSLKKKGNTIKIKNKLTFAHFW